MSETSDQTTVRDMWCDVLRHPKPLFQVSGTLDDGGDGRCCLGVLLEVQTGAPPRFTLDYPDQLQTSELPSQYTTGLADWQLNLLADWNDASSSAGGHVSLEPDEQFTANPHEVRLSFAEIGDMVQMFFVPLREQYPNG